MTQKNQATTPAVNRTLLAKRMMLGAGISLTLMILFLLPVRDPKPEWGRLWMIRPLIVISLAGAGGGAFYYIMDRLSQGGGWKRAGTIILSIVIYIVALWLGTVLGLDGTLWD